MSATCFSNNFASEEKKVKEPTRRAEVLGFLLDYDGCCGAVYPEGAILEEIATLVENRYRSSQYSKLILASGSNRQSLLLDKQNWQINNNGSSFFFLSLLNEVMKKRGVNSFLYMGLQQDEERSKPTGYYWQKALDAIGPSITNVYNCQYTRIPKEDLTSGWWQKDKSRLISDICSKIAKDHKETQIDFVFVDDKEEILQEVSKNIM